MAHTTEIFVLQDNPGNLLAFVRFRKLGTGCLKYVNKGALLNDGKYRTLPLGHANPKNDLLY
jgi:hypothetical protein